MLLCMTGADYCAYSKKDAPKCIEIVVVAITPLIPKPIGLTVLHKEQEGDGSKSSHIENIPPVLFDLVEQAVTE